MKNLLSLLTAASLTVNALSQLPGTALMTTSAGVLISESKLTPERANEIPMRVVRHFVTTHGNAEEVSWARVSNGSVVYFKEDGIDTKMAYKINGQPSYLLRFYKENRMPEAIRRQVKSKYFDYSIFMIIEVLANDQTIYLVKMEDKDSYKTVRVCDGEMKVVENLKKG